MAHFKIVLLYINIKLDLYSDLPCLAESADGWVAHAHNNGEERVQILKLSTAEGIKHAYIKCLSNLKGNITCYASNPVQIHHEF